MDSTYVHLVFSSTAPKASTATTENPGRLRYYYWPAIPLQRDGTIEFDLANAESQVNHWNPELNSWRPSPTASICVSGVWPIRTDVLRTTSTNLEYNSPDFFHMAQTVSQTCGHRPLHLYGGLISPGSTYEEPIRSILGLDRSRARHWLFSGVIIIYWLGFIKWLDFSFPVSHQELHHHQYHFVSCIQSRGVSRFFCFSAS